MLEEHQQKKYVAINTVEVPSRGKLRLCEWEMWKITEQYMHEISMRK